MIVLIIICFIMWLFMMWLTYSKKLNSVNHLITKSEGVLYVRDTPIARLIKGLSVSIAIDEIRQIEATNTHVILRTAKSSVDLFINHRFINNVLDYLKEELDEIEIKDLRPIGK
ncbi:hypothetical protein [Pseudoalteromonas sp.]|uniref:hypothetical protein n=1 Tax=Pseudoalteromonas sp. TaxID=53249 RepID=UPI00356A4509